MRRLYRSGLLPAKSNLRIKKSAAQKKRDPAEQAGGTPVFTPNIPSATLLFHVKHSAKFSGISALVPARFTPAFPSVIYTAFCLSVKQFFTLSPWRKQL